MLTEAHQDTRFIASGSAAALNLKIQESRTCRFTDFFLPPLIFAEFLVFRGVESALITTHAHGPTLRYVMPEIHRLNEALVSYLNFGYYPEAVLNETIQRDTQRFLCRDTIDKVLLRDLTSLYGIQDIQELNRRFTTTAYHSGQEISLDCLAQSSGIAKNTISKHLDYLEAAFLVVRMRRIDETGKSFKHMRNFKVYLTNRPMRAELLTPMRYGDAPMGGKVETAIISQSFHSKLMSNVHHARWKKGRRDREVDLVQVDPATTKTVGPETQVRDLRIKHFPCALYCYQIGTNVAEERAP